MAQANEILQGFGVKPDETAEVSAIQRAAPQAEPAPQPEPATFTAEPIKNGKAILYRGDVDAMRAQLEQSNIPPGMVKIEDGQPVGIYYPASYHEKVSQALNIEEPHAQPPLENVAPQVNARAETATIEHPDDAPATDRAVAGDEIKPLQPGLDSNQPVAANNDAAVTAPAVASKATQHQTDDRNQVIENAAPAVTYSKEEAKPEPANPQTFGDYVKAFAKDNPQMFRTHLLPGKTVREMVGEDGQDTYLGQSHEDGAQVHKIALDQGEGKHGAIGKIYEDKNNVWIDAASLKSNYGAGERLYNMAESLALNTGKNFKEDPAGVSDMAMYRRPWHQLSMLLKSGTADNIEPGEFLSTQRVGGPKTRPINYPANRNYDAMLREHLLTVYHNTALAVPEIKGITYDLKSGQSKDGSGNVVSDGDFQRLADARRTNPVRAAMVRDADSGDGLSAPPVGWRSL